MKQGGVERVQGKSLIEVNILLSNRILRSCVTAVGDFGLYFSLVVFVPGIIKDRWYWPLSWRDTEQVN